MHVDGDEALPPIRVGIADFGVSSAAPLSTSGLGSCLGVAFIDRSASIGGLLHPMLPYRPEGDSRTPATYVDAGITTLLDAMSREGAATPRIEAKLTGGAKILDVTAEDSIGDRNIAAAREVLAATGIEIIAEDVGGSVGRTVKLDPKTGSLEVKRAGADVLTL